MNILVIDDEKNICLSIQGILEDEGYNCDYKLNFEDGFKAMKSKSYDIVFLDIWLPDRDGTEGLRDIKRHFPESEVVMISGHGNVENAVDSIRVGAYDFLQKPLSLDRILVIVNQLKDKRKIVNELRQSKFNLLKKYDLIGVSREIDDLKKRIEKIAPTNAWVLITGENGTGKEHVARLIHMMSKRSQESFIEINCSAVPSELIESELFGHEKGSFTGAVARKQGKIELANRGTLFLDEIGDMELSMQAKLLRVLETGDFTRVGGNEKISSDFRLISATNKDLDTAIASNYFREDLYYRINVIPIEVPPLRKRATDIPYLVNHFLQEACSMNGVSLKTLDVEAMDILTKFEWPGNVRQIKNVVERMVVLSENDIITKNDIPDFITENSTVTSDIYVPLSIPLKDARDEFEKQYIMKALRVSGWNVTKAAELLDIERTYLHRKIKAYGIEQLKYE